MNQNDNIDLSEPNIVGAIDRFATNIALAGLAIIPSFLIVVFMPWRLTPMIINNRADGRAGALLAPGVFFPLILVASLLFFAATAPDFTAGAGAVSTLDIEIAPEASVASEDTSNVSSNTVSGVFVGNDDIREMAAAWRAGEINQILIVIFPIFTACVVAFAATGWLRVLVGKWWTIRVAIRSGFYIFGALMGIGCLVGILLYRMDLPDDLSRLISSLASLAILVLFPWWYSSIFKAGGVAGIGRIVGASILATLSILTAFVLIGLLL